MTVQFDEVKLGAIYIVNLDDAAGHEQDKTRPAVAMVKHETKLIVVVPFTTKLESKRFPYTLSVNMSSINGLTSDSIALVFQVRPITFRRFEKRIGTLEDEHISRIKESLSLYLDL